MYVLVYTVVVYIWPKRELVIWKIHQDYHLEFEMENMEDN